MKRVTSSTDRMTVNASTEKAVHDSLRNVLHEIWDKHRICVQSIHTDWIDTSTPSEPGMILRSLELITTSKV